MLAMTLYLIGHLDWARDAMESASASYKDIPEEDRLAYTNNLSNDRNFRSELK